MPHRPLVTYSSSVQNGSHLNYVTGHQVEEHEAEHKRHIDDVLKYNHLTSAPLPDPNIQVNCFSMLGRIFLGAVHPLWRKEVRGLIGPANDFANVLMSRTDFLIFQKFVGLESISHHAGQSVPFVQCDSTAPWQNGDFLYLEAVFYFNAGDLHWNSGPLRHSIMLEQVDYSNPMNSTVLSHGKSLFERSNQALPYISAGSSGLTALQRHRKEIGSLRWPGTFHETLWSACCSPNFDSVPVGYHYHSMVSRLICVLVALM